MRVLIFGGTRFVGRAVAEDARARGWSVTILNRGNRPAPEGVTVLHGDRTRPDGLAALGDGEWDIVVDTWSFAPSVVRQAAGLLKDRADRYVYVSSRSVYPFPTPAEAGEDVPVIEAAPDDGDDVDYPRAKAGGELAATEAFGDRALLLRAGLILGPGEDIGRLPWWLRRIARGGSVLAPGPPETGLQFIDARDLAAWALDAAERGLGGPYNTVSPPGHATMRGLLEACVEATGADAELCWTDPEPILAAGIQPWNDLPIWIPPGEAHDALHRGDVSKAVAVGLRCRPAEATVADTWAWMQELGAWPPAGAEPSRVGIDPEVEARVLASS
jgi:2'-hydroxyisoflavone reductase